MAKVRTVIPIYNDWENVRQVLARLNTVMAAQGEAIDVTLIDDGSTEERSWGAAFLQELDHLESVEVVQMHTNRGQTYALVMGLGFVTANRPCEAVVIMDGDGEDRPEDVPTLLKASRAAPKSIVVAERRRRTEGVRFRFFYAVFKRVFYWMTGRRISFGNFSVCPWYALKRLVQMPELINHYPAAVVRSRLPCQRIPIDRGTRLTGKSFFGFLGHLQHGFGALAVDLDRMMVRIMVAVGAGLLALSTLIAVVVLLKMTGPSIVSGWASIIVGLAIVLAAQSVVFAFLLIFISLRTRGLQSMVPARAYANEIANVDLLKGTGEMPRV